MLSAAEGPTTANRLSISGKSSINITSEWITFEVLLTKGFPSWHFLRMVCLGQILQDWLNMEIRAVHWGRSSLSGGCSCAFPSKNLLWWVLTSFWDERKQRQTHAGRSNARRAQSCYGVILFFLPPTLTPAQRRAIPGSQREGGGSCASSKQDRKTPKFCLPKGKAKIAEKSEKASHTSSRPWQKLYHSKKLKEKKRKWERGKKKRQKIALVELAKLQ